MSIFSRRFLGVLLAAACLFAAVAAVNAETCSLELKRLKPIGQGMMIGPTPPLEYLYRSGQPQHFFMQSGVAQPAGQKTPFSKIVKKEPKYETENPLRGVAKLGSGEYIFAVDAVAEKSDSKAPKSKAGTEKPKADAEKSKAAPKPPKAVTYNRLYFDFNQNGDLTDDKPIVAKNPARNPGIVFGGNVNFSQSEFPRVDLKIDVDGEKIDYAFLFRIYSQTASNFSYVSAQLNAAAYREGKFELDGKQRHVVLLDYNSNGRFDDVVAIDENMTDGNGSVFPTQGDLLLVDPDPKKAASSPYSRDPAAGEGRHHVSKLVSLDGQYYDMAVTPAGDKLTLERSSVPVGKVTSPVDGLKAVVYGKLGVLNFSGGKGEPILLPEGEWKLLSYMIDRTGIEEPKDESAEKKKPERSLLESLAGALTGGVGSATVASQPRFTHVSARAAKDCKPMQVKAGETVALAFGPPWKPVVKASTVRPGSNASLSLVLVGSGGEVCNDLMVNGGRPKAPEFTITTPDGDEVAKGKFEYG
ncbi:MAG: hypothetical protein HQ567_07585 [Candidatus Nealsonbacteria bacterium]|nr:hypothetical protein [Candidatus Nealsonbacteria bacterium]